ncbi:peroxiredoxin [Sphingomonas sabuli]|uniref:thioredoxin-dependent peroxiredoxin n=1 Tax=Sphingomonas sabuli TaxID=2764186 RepID=A0A7G9L1Q5_9SPHN|nr:peroxiredoxin [Sphingomonas sabuli]QNM82554.1 peroxiredoxin [Sphingomonas sabuli]
MIDEGDRAPALDVATSGGQTVNLARPGRPLVLYFYPKDDTSGCTRQAQDFTAMAGDFEKAGATVIGVSRDPMKKHEKFIGKYDLKVPLASDEDGQVSDAFGTWVQKSMYGRKYMGMERSTFLIGGDGQVLKVWRKVKVPGHAEEVLKAVRDA